MENLKLWTTKDSHMDIICTPMSCAVCIDRLFILCFTLDFVCKCLTIRELANPYAHSLNNKILTNNKFWVAVYSYTLICITICVLLIGCTVDRSICHTPSKRDIRKAMLYSSWEYTIPPLKH